LTDDLGPVIGTDQDDSMENGPTLDDNFHNSIPKKKFNWTNFSYNAIVVIANKLITKH
jgi:hypothetical protein